MNIRKILPALALLVSVQAGANPISRQEARQVAQQFVGINDATSDQVPNAPYYVFSRGAGKGFVIVSGDDETAPILGYTDEGDFNADKMPEGLQNMLNNWATKITRLQQAQKQRGANQAPRRRTISQRLQVPAYKQAWQDVPELIKTRWNQGYPYNIFAPNRSDNGQKTLTGCEATAAAQIVYYFRRDNPDTLLYDTPTYNESWFNAPVTLSLPAGTPVRYDLMRLSGTGTLAQDTAVSVLMYAVGTCAHLGYGYQDGTATAGNTDQMGNSISSQFNLDNDYVGKWNYSQEGWEALVYNNVRSGRPLLYSGANDTQGGHAVVLDGYQASTGLYHFNFGWGGAGNGYYTVDDSTGMNGFNSGQAALVNITPKRQRLIGKLEAEKFYLRSQGDIHATIYNKGTLSYSGVYVYCGYTKNMPSRSTDSETGTYIASGDSATFTFTYRPTQHKTVYIWLTDANKNILDTLQVEVSQSMADLHLNSIAVDAGTSTSNHDGITFKQVNDTKAHISVNLTNGEQGTYCQPIIICQADTLNGTTGEWQKAMTRSVNKLTFRTGETRDTVFTFTGLQEGKYYRVMMSKRVSAGVNTQMAFDTPDSVVYFTVRKPTLDLTVNGRTATVTGDWNAARFIDKATDATVTSYDMTAVNELNEQPVAANENALFLAAAPVAGGHNIIVNGVCDSLVIHTASEFRAPQNFTARKAVLVIDSAKVGTWGDVVVPFAAEVPYGMQGRVITEIGKYQITLDNVRQVEAMQPLLYLTDRDDLRTIEADNAAITTDTVATALDGLWHGSTVNTALTRKASLLQTPENTRIPTYYQEESGTPLAPFTTELDSIYRNGYRAFNSKNVNADRNYTFLADTINLAYQVIAQYGEPARAFLADSLTKFEDMFTYYTYTGSDHREVKAAYENLGELIRKYLANPVTDGIRQIEMPAEAADDSQAPVMYFTIDGQRLDRPQRGIIIVKKGNKVRKMIVR